MQYNINVWNLFTLFHENNLLCKMRMSAGTLSPPLTHTISPTTSSTTFVSLRSPSRMARVFCGIIFWNLSMIFVERYSWRYEKVAVIRITMMSTTPKIKFDLSVRSQIQPVDESVITKPSNARRLPIHSHSPKPPTRLRANFTSSGVCFSGRSVFAPSRARRFSASTYKWCIHYSRK